MSFLANSDLSFCFCLYIYFYKYVKFLDISFSLTTTTQTVTLFKTKEQVFLHTKTRLFKTTIGTKNKVNYNDHFNCK